MLDQKIVLQLRGVFLLHSWNLKAIDLRPQSKWYFRHGSSSFIGSIELRKARYSWGSIIYDPYENEGLR